MWKKLKPYLISVLIAFAVGGLAALLTKNSMSMYEEISKPALAPPGWIFPVAWSILYTLSRRGIIRTRLKISILGIFWLVVLERHKAYCVLRTKTYPKIQDF